MTSPVAAVTTAVATAAAALEMICLESFVEGPKLQFDNANNWEHADLRYTADDMMTLGDDDDDDDDEKEEEEEGKAS